MKKFLFGILLCLVLTIPNILRSVSAERPMILAFNANYAPFCFLQDGKNLGIEVDILTEALGKRMKLPIAIQMGPWLRMLDTVKKGEADAFCATPTAERKEWSIPSNTPVIEYPLKIYVSKNNPKLGVLKGVKTIDDLRNGALAGKFTLGGGLGDAWIQANLEAYKVKIDWADSMQGTIMKVANLRVDAYVNNAIVEKYSTKLLVDSLSAKGNKDDLKKVLDIAEMDPVIELNQFYLCVAKTSPYKKYLDQFDNVLQQMQKDGTVDQIMKKYK